MKLRELLIGTAMVSLTFVSASATTPTIPSPLIAEDKILGSAYYDTLSILSTSNECSNFFGGSAASVEAFNELIAKVRTAYLSSSIGIRMSGAQVNMINMRTKNKYRLFDKVLINRLGPFYRRNYLVTEPSVRGVGTFQPSTKEARVLMFLHELGHVVQGEGGNWLLPDDGRDEAQSRDNTRKIENVCGDQIKSLGKADLAKNFADGKQKQPDERLTPAVTKP